MFAGIGGFRLGLEQHGLKCVWSNEIDYDAKRSYQANFGFPPADVPIEQIPAEAVPKHDILCAGFPCQPFSISGTRQGLQDKRGNLFFEIIRIAQYRRPKLMLLENVPHLLRMEGGAVIKLIKESLATIGYKTYYDTLNASHYGIPQSRKRVYFVCVDVDSSLSYQAPSASLESVCLADILEKNPQKHLFIKEKFVLASQPQPTIVPNPNQLQLAGYLGDKWLKSEDSGRQRKRIHSPAGHAPTLTAQADYSGTHGGRYLDGKKIRRLSILECKRLMGFPDDWVLAGSETSQYRQLGNAIIPKMVSLVYQGVS